MMARQTATGIVECEMTLNEIIAWAKEHHVDFDNLVLIPHEGAVDIQQLEVSFRAGKGTNGLVVRIF